jgi:hypothetical protein
MLDDEKKSKFEDVCNRSSRHLWPSRFRKALWSLFPLYYRCAADERSGPMVTLAPSPGLGYGYKRPPNRAAYSAEQETQTLPSLADGTHITGGRPRVAYISRFPRPHANRGDAAADAWGEASKPPVVIDITDPVDGYQYTPHSNSPTSQRPPIGPVVPSASDSGSAVGAPAIDRSPGAPPRPDISTEQPGTETIEGVLSIGTTTTAAYLGGSGPLGAIRPGSFCALNGGLPTSDQPFLSAHRALAGWNFTTALGAFEVYNLLTNWAWGRAAVSAENPGAHRTWMR